MGNDRFGVRVRTSTYDPVVRLVGLLTDPFVLRPRQQRQRERNLQRHLQRDRCPRLLHQRELQHRPHLGHPFRC